MFSGCLVTKDSGSADFGDPRKKLSLGLEDLASTTVVEHITWQNVSLTLFFAPQNFPTTVSPAKSCPDRLVPAW